MLGFKGVRGWIVVAAVCGLAAGASAVKAFQPTGPAVGTGAMPLKTLFAQVKLTTKDYAECSTSCAMSGSAQVFEVPQGQTFVVTDLATIVHGSGQYPWPEKTTVPNTSASVPENLVISACIAADGIALLCSSPQQMYYGGAHLTTGLAIPSGAKVELWARLQPVSNNSVSTGKWPVLATGYLMRN